MVRSIEDFLDDWKAEREKSMQIFSAVTDAALPYSATPDGRTLGRLAWHITCSVGEMMQRTGLPVQCPKEEEPIPSSMEEIRTHYEHVATELHRLITEQWNDDTLRETRDMYGEAWANGFTLDVLLRHQIHHRAQMTVLLRLAGLPVPGIYGPSREEWAQFGMPALP
jgi:uncharacterized damage-inducible protein DinB